MGLLEITTKEYYKDGYFHGSYQFTRLTDIINQFMIVYVGEDKIIPKAKRTDVAFHAQRAMQELSFDTFKSCKAHEITVPPSLKMTLPIDYVNYTKVSWVDSSGIKHIIYPEDKSSNPKNFYQNDDGDYIIDPIATLTSGSNVYVLDGDYSDILVHGMRVTGGSATAPTPLPIPGNATIGGITTTAGITSIELVGYAPQPFPLPPTIFNKNATVSTDQRIRIFRFIGLGTSRLRGDSYSTADTTVTASFPPGSFEIAVASTAGIKKGMYINHPSFVNDASVVDASGKLASIKVVGVGTNTVELSHAATYTGLTSQSFNFVSYEEKSQTWDNYKSGTPSENQDDYIDDTYWPMAGNRYGLDPQRAQANGSFYIDCVLGEIHFSSNLSGKTVVLDYLSDSIGTDGEMRVHKFAEEAMYKWITYAILSTRANIQEYVVRRFKKEKFAAVRTAKLRLSNIKLEEITQILRGKSKQIKH